MRGRTAFSMVEVLVALFLMGLLILGLYQVSRMARAETMDASYELVALALAREPIEILRGLGYQALVQYGAHPLPQFPLGETSVSDRLPEGRHYPASYLTFKRHLSLVPVESNGLRAMRVIVRVFPRQAGWLSRQELSLEGIVVEKPQW